MAKYGRLEIVRRFISNEFGSAVAIILYVFTIFAAGGLYTIFFIKVAPVFYDMIPASVYKDVILGFIYFIPLLIILMAILSLIQSGLKRYGYAGVEYR